MQVFSNIPVMPYEELLQANIGLSTHRGGPLFPDWENQLHARHLRGSRQRVDALPSERKCVEDWAFSGVWAGPFCGHFGHQISEFSMRLPQSLVEHPESPVVFGLRYDSQISEFSKLPDYFRSIVGWFGISPDRVKLLKQPTLLAELFVYPQSEMLSGAAPSQEHLNTLTSLMLKNLGASKASGTIYVSRSRFASGRMAGERYFEEYLRAHGVSIVFPELLSLSEQLRLYFNAQHLIFAEGSALHSLQLLGQGLKDVSVLMRRPGAAMFRNFVEARSETYKEINLVQGLLCSYNVFGTPLDAMGLSLFDEGRILEWISAIGIPVTGWSSSGFSSCVESDIRVWLSRELNRQPLYHRTKNSILNVLRASGFLDIANDVDHAFPAVAEIKPIALNAYREALSLESKGSIDLAVEAITKAIENDSSFDDFHIKRSAWLSALGRNKEAWLSVSTVSGISSSSNTRLLSHSAELAFKSEEIESALLMIDGAIVIEPKNPSFHSRKSVFLDRLGRMDEALGAAKVAVELQPDNYHTLAHYSNLLAKAGTLEEAIEVLAKIIAVAPDKGNFYHQQSVLLQRLGRCGEALLSGQKAIALAPKNPNFLVHLSNVYAASEQLECALTEIERAIHIDSKKTAFYRQKAQFLERMSRNADALETILVACSLAPGDSSLKSTAAGIASKLGNGEMAISLINEAITLAPTNGPFHGQLSVFLDRLGRSEEAEISALQSIDLQPNNPHARAHLSNVLARIGDLNGALHAIDEAIQMKPADSGFYRQKSIWLLRQGEHDKALDAARKAVEFAPRDAFLYAHLANILVLQKLHVQALIEIDFALSIDSDSEAFKNLRNSIVKVIG